jgi:hypothetical protein
MDAIPLSDLTVAEPLDVVIIGGGISAPRRRSFWPPVGE